MVLFNPNISVPSSDHNFLFCDLLDLITLLFVEEFYIFIWATIYWTERRYDGRSCIANEYSKHNKRADDFCVAN